MLNLVIAFVAGLLVADFAWGWKTGQVQRMWRRLFPVPIHNHFHYHCPHCTHCHPEEEDDKDYEHDEDEVDDQFAHAKSENPGTSH